MLGVRASTVRHASRLARTFATIVDGLKVAAVDHGQPTCSVTVLAKAGSRYESTPGVAHALKNFAFKSTASRSALGIVRESELYGGVLSSTLSREHLAITAEFLRGDEAFFVDLLSSFITSAKLTQHELDEYVLPVLESEAAVGLADPAKRAVELAHALAFRTGLGGGSLAWPGSLHPALDDVKQYAKAAFAKGNFAVLGTGIQQDALARLVEKSLGALYRSDSAAPTSAPSTYFGGETRVEAHGGPQTVFIGFGTTGTQQSAELAVLSAHLSPEPSVKWSSGSTSPITEVGLPLGTTVRTILLPYSDATLFGLLIQGETAEGVREAGKIAVKALKDGGSGASVKEPALKKAVAKAKFTSASALDGREGILSALGAKILDGSDVSVEARLGALDKVTMASLSKAGTALLKGKTTYVAIGDTGKLPHLDEIGL